jgi:hypothetical protein
VAEIAIGVVVVVVLAVLLLAGFQGLRLLRRFLRGELP